MSNRDHFLAGASWDYSYSGSYRLEMEKVWWTPPIWWGPHARIGRSPSPSMKWYENIVEKYWTSDVSSIISPFPYNFPFWTQQTSLNFPHNVHQQWQQYLLCRKFYPIFLLYICPAMIVPVVLRFADKFFTTSVFEVAFVLMTTALCMSQISSCSRWSCSFVFFSSLFFFSSLVLFSSLYILIFSVYLLVSLLYYPSLAILEEHHNNPTTIKVRKKLPKD